MKYVGTWAHSRGDAPSDAAADAPDPLRPDPARRAAPTGVRLVGPFRRRSGRLRDHGGVNRRPSGSSGPPSGRGLAEPAPDSAAARRRQRLAAQRRRRRVAGVAVVVLAGAVIIGAVFRSLPSTATGQSAAATSPATTKASLALSRLRRTTVVRLVSTPAGRLPSPVQDAAAAPIGVSSALLIGGLTAADTSTGDIVRIGSTGSRRIGALRVPVHDAAAALLPSGVFLFGGGDGVRQHAEIIRVDPAGGRSTVVGRLPAPSSDQAGAAIGSTAYVVGGYTGTRLARHDRCLAARGSGHESSRTCRRRCATRR